MALYKKDKPFFDEIQKTLFLTKKEKEETQIKQTLF
jgi:hypothetical protein